MATYELKFIKTLQAKGKILQCETLESNHSVSSVDKIIQRWNEYVIARVYKPTINLLVLIIKVHHCYQLHVHSYATLVSEWKHSLLELNSRFSSKKATQRTVPNIIVFRSVPKIHIKIQEPMILLALYWRESLVGNTEGTTQTDREWEKGDGKHIWT